MDQAKADYIRAIVERQKSLVASVRHVEEELASFREDTIVSQHMIEYLERDERASKI